MNPYVVLGISENATMAEVVAAYRRLANLHHPDKPKGNASKFIQIKDAFRSIADGSYELSFGDKDLLKEATRELIDLFNRVTSAEIEMMLQPAARKRNIFEVMRNQLASRDFELSYEIKSALKYSRATAKLSKNISTSKGGDSFLHDELRKKRMSLWVKYRAFQREVRKTSIMFKLLEGYDYEVSDDPRVSPGAASHSSVVRSHYNHFV